MDDLSSPNKAVRRNGLKKILDISIKTEMMIHTDLNEREKNSIETSQRVKHTGTNSTRNDLAS